MAHGEVHHDYHLVDPSPWPIVGATAAFLMLIGAVFWMNTNANFFGLPVNGQPWVMIIGFLLVLYTMAGWWREVVRESVVQGRSHAGGQARPALRHDPVHRLRSDVLLRLVLGLLQFRAVPDRCLHRQMAAARHRPIRPLAFSAAQHADPADLGRDRHLGAPSRSSSNDRKGAIQGLIVTIALGASFTCVQAYEYSHAAFTFGFNNAQLMPFMDEAHKSLTASATGGMGNLNAIYGSTFFMATGFHGLHVIIGTIFLTVCLFRAIAGHFTPARHFGFEAAAWYWHFVDVVWLFLFACIYVWGSYGVMTE